MAAFGVGLSERFLEISGQTVLDMKKLLIETIFSHKIYGNFCFKSFFLTKAVWGQWVKMCKK